MVGLLLATLREFLEDFFVSFLSFLQIFIIDILLVLVTHSFKRWKLVQIEAFLLVAVDPLTGNFFALPSWLP
jgi:hypothetical protein